MSVRVLSLRSWFWNLQRVERCFLCSVIKLSDSPAWSAKRGHIWGDCIWWIDCLEMYILSSLDFGCVVWFPRYVYWLLPGWNLLHTSIKLCIWIILLIIWASAVRFSVWFSLSWGVKVTFQSPPMRICLCLCMLSTCVFRMFVISVAWIVFIGMSMFWIWNSVLCRVMWQVCR